MIVTLRPWREEDSVSVSTAANNPNIAANLRNAFPSPYTLDDARSYIRDCIDKGEDRQLTRAIVIDGRAVGSIGIFPQSDVYERSAELGYWLAEEYWGKGVMTEAVVQLCREAFARFPLLRIYAEVYDYNQGSRRVLEKAGFTCEGTMQNGVFKNGTVHSYCMYALLRDEI